MQRVQFPPRGHHIFLTLLLGAAIGDGTAHAASVITQTVSYEYDATTGAKNKTIQEPDNPQLRLETTLTYDKGGAIGSTTISSPATGLAGIATRVTSVLYDGPVYGSETTNPLGHITTTNVDSGWLRRTRVNAPDRSFQTAQYDTFGRPILSRASDGTQKKMVYAYCTGVNSGTEACPEYAQYVATTTPYASDGTIVSGAWSKQYIDALGRAVRTETQGFDGTSIITVDTKYDRLGRVLMSSRPYYAGQAPKWTSYGYDVLGRVVTVTTPDGKTVTTSYEGLTTKVTNALEQTQTTVVNSQGQVVQVVDAQNKALTYSYDANGKLSKTVDPQGNVITMTYDVLGRKLTMIDPDLGTTTYAYDVLGELVQQTDNKGQVTTMTYDLLGRMKTRTENDLVSTWEYDSCHIGVLCKVSADNGYIKTITYDSVARPTGTSTTIGSAFSTAVTYDTAGRVATQTYPSGLVVKYVYTSLGYLSEVRNNISNALYWKANTRDAESHLTQQTYGNGVVTQQVFDPATGRMTNSYAGAGNSVQNLSFTYDARGNMLTRSDGNQNLAETFLYDSLNRLTSNTVNSTGAGLVTQTYSYDSIGNITSRSDMGTYTYGVGAGPHAVTQIAQADGSTRQYNYDKNGNLVQEVQRDAAGNIVASMGRTEAYSSFNMPTTLANANATLTFVYGPDHQRIKQIASNGTTTIYLHPDNEGGLSFEKDIKPNNGFEYRNFITAGSGVVAMVKQVGTGTTISATSSLYMHRDQLGSTTVVTDESGAVVERFAYEPFGKRRTLVGVQDGANTIAGVTTDRGFTNHEHLDEVGLIHMNGRVYDPKIGRFISADLSVPYPTNLQSFNRYSYARNNALIRIDPSGFTDYLSMGIERLSEDGGSFAGGWSGGFFGGGSGNVGFQIPIILPPPPITSVEVVGSRQPGSDIWSLGAVRAQPIKLWVFGGIVEGGWLIVKKVGVVSCLVSIVCDVEKLPPLLNENVEDNNPPQPNENNLDKLPEKGGGDKAAQDAGYVNAHDAKSGRGDSKVNIYNDKTTGRKWLWDGRKGTEKEIL